MFKTNKFIKRKADICRINIFLHTLGKLPAYQEVYSSVNHIIQLQHTFVALVPPKLVEHCVIGKLSKQVLSIYVDSSAVAAKLKHIVPTLLEKFGPQVISIKIMLRRQQSKPSGSVSSRQKPSLSQTAIDNLNRLALDMPASPLKSAIEIMLAKCL